MQFLYIVIAMIISIGVGTFAGPDAQHRTTKVIEQNRAIAYQEQSEIFARSVRRQVQLNPGAFSNVSGQDGQTKLSKEQLRNSEFGGYRMQGRFLYLLDNTGRIIARLAPDIEDGPDGLHSLRETVEQALLEPAAGREIGRLDLAKIGILGDLRGRAETLSMGP